MYMNEKILRIKTPPMGWNSWDCYGASVTEETVRAKAEATPMHSRAARRMATILFFMVLFPFFGRFGPQGCSLRKDIFIREKIA